MAKYIGVDWAGRGWFAVILHDDGRWDADLLPSILSVWKYHSDAERILVDVPIGLPTVETGRRVADREAKELLGPRQGSVFYTPVREAVYEPTLAAAKETNERAGYSIQNQAWGIVPRIREVDEFLDMYPVARDRIRETHPEVCFRTFAGEPLSSSKRTAAGVAERRTILEGEFERAASIYPELQAFREPAYAPTVSQPHDLLDALVAAVTARRPADELATLPADPPTDERGLPMEIVHPSSTVQTTLPDH